MAVYIYICIYCLLFIPFCCCWVDVPFVSSKSAPTTPSLFWSYQRSSMKISVMASGNSRQQKWGVQLASLLLYITWLPCMIHDYLIVWLIPLETEKCRICSIYLQGLTGEVWRGNSLHHQQLDDFFLGDMRFFNKYGGSICYASKILGQRKLQGRGGTPPVVGFEVIVLMATTQPPVYN